MTVLIAYKGVSTQFTVSDDMTVCELSAQVSARLEIEDFSLHHGTIILQGAERVDKTLLTHLTLHNVSVFLGVVIRLMMKTNVSGDEEYRNCHKW